MSTHKNPKPTQQREKGSAFGEKEVTNECETAWMEGGRKNYKVWAGTQQQIMDGMGEMRWGKGPQTE